MKTLFASGCALRAYKPQLVQRLACFLTEAGVAEGTYDACCKAQQKPEEDTALLLCCPGCAHMFRARCPDSAISSVWKVLLDTDFPFPDYHGERMTIHDACHARNRNSAEMQAAARALCGKMNIELVEPAHTRDAARCCGGSAPDLETRKAMARRRAMELPEKNVVVYCTGCVRSLSVTDVRPRHLLDLLFGEPTEGLTLKKEAGDGKIPSHG